MAKPSAVQLVRQDETLVAGSRLMLNALVKQERQMAKTYGIATYRAATNPDK